MQAFWHDFLYTPLLNILMFLYSGPATESLGLAIIMLTVLLRVVLLPLTLLDERSRYRYEKLNKKFEALERDFRTDPVKRSEKTRDLLKEHKVNYWSKVLVLGIQLLVLILLYQVFVGGIRFTAQEQLYTWVTAPAKVNTMFLGFDLKAKSLGWAVAVGVVLFLQIYGEQKRREHLIKRSDVMYLLFFPVFSVIVLLMLPMVKSLFVLTSLGFSMLVYFLRKMVIGTPKAGDGTVPAEK